MKKKLIFASLKSLKEGVGSGIGSGSISQRWGSESGDPDLDQNVTDPQHWLIVLKLLSITEFTNSSLKSLNFFYNFSRMFEDIIIFYLIRYNWLINYFSLFFCHMCDFFSEVYYRGFLCCGSVTFWYGSGSADPVPLTNGSRILLFSSVTFKVARKIFFNVFLLITFWSYIYIIFMDNKSYIKK